MKGSKRTQYGGRKEWKEGKIEGLGEEKVRSKKEHGGTEWRIEGGDEGGKEVRRKQEERKESREERKKVGSRGRV